MQVFLENSQRLILEQGSSLNTPRENPPVSDGRAASFDNCGILLFFLRLNLLRLEWLKQLLDFTVVQTNPDSLLQLFTHLVILSEALNIFRMKVNFYIS